MFLRNLRGAPGIVITTLICTSGFPFPSLLGVLVTVERILNRRKINTENMDAPDFSGGMSGHSVRIGVVH